MGEDCRMQDRLVRWSEEWQMLFNTNKCKVIHFGRNNLHIKYTMMGTEGIKLKVNVRELLRRLPNEMYLEDARANR